MGAYVVAEDRPARCPDDKRGGKGEKEDHPETAGTQEKEEKT